ncbi:hypothetical protein [Truepera radiovictrix]|uniref:Uncharacterized protein n=1 Tax=Truepera radiovictrix (strain DSM 17093 / CIP 108686 / LMG 22925 / RQ-24) TaxID=649638 RepID=D7CR28_TRURR|nr:hypothetical protein [Truepera radiovictrix]ADI13428.1 hypothetical protein Trad_0288 [Truepera radiovictrix DSM 17093]WMT58011.1 hypothetical protein RCV51_03435 [Truepera radiovictrix]
MDWTDWHALEAAIPLDELPAFHRAFLAHHRPGEADWEGAFLRQVQGKVQATLKGLQREGRARLEGGTLWVSCEAIPEAFRRYADR